jgi:proteasome accessory factor B
MAKPRRRAPGRRTGTYSQAARVLRLLDELRDLRNGLPLRDLAARFAVTERQLRRDLAVLEEAGHELAWIDDDDGPRRVKLRVDRQLVRLGIGDRFALLAIRRVFDVLEGTPLHDYVRSVQDRLIESLPAKDRAELDTFGERFVYVPDGGLKPYKDKAEILDGLLDGVVRRQPVRFRYRTPADKVTGGTLEPWAIALFRQGLYVIGCATEVNGKATAPLPPGGKPWVYAAERFELAEPVAAATFEVPKDFKLDDLIQGAFGLWISGQAPSHVVIDFDAKVRALIEARTWHPTQRLRRLPDGGVRLAFDVADTTLVKSWVLSWGPLARIREPAALVDAIRADAAAMPGRYADAAT